MALVDHEVDVVYTDIPSQLTLDKVHENPEQLVGVKTSGSEIVVSVEAVVEMESPEFPLPDKVGDNLLDINTVRVMPEVDKDLRAVTRQPREIKAATVVLDSG